MNCLAGGSHEIWQKDPNDEDVEALKNEAAKKPKQDLTFTALNHDKRVPTDRGAWPKKLKYQKVVKKKGSANSPKLSKKYRQNLQKKTLPIRPKRNYQKIIKNSPKNMFQH